MTEPIKLDAVAVLKAIAVQNGGEVGYSDESYEAQKELDLGLERNGEDNGWVFSVGEFDDQD